MEGVLANYLKMTKIQQVIGLIASIPTVDLDVEWQGDLRFGATAGDYLNSSRQANAKVITPAMK